MKNEELGFQDILTHLHRESAHFVVRLETHHSGRIVTVVQSDDLIRDSIDIHRLAHELREALGKGAAQKIIPHGDNGGRPRINSSVSAFQPKTLKRSSDGRKHLVAF